MMAKSPEAGPPPSHDVVDLCRDLIRINTSNPTHTERQAAEYVAAVLATAGLSFEWFEPQEGRSSLVGRMDGADPTLPPLLIHAHLDVVPAIAEEWSVDPFAGVIKDDCVWGRGAVDMKGMVAVVLAVLRLYTTQGTRPRRDLVLAFFADEESGGQLGAAHAVASRPDLFSQCEDAIGEGGGFSHRVGARRAYFVSTAEKGVLWARLDATGVSGHGSMLNERNAVTEIGRALTRIADHHFPRTSTSTGKSVVGQLAALLGLGSHDESLVLDRVGPMAKLLGAGLRDTCNPTSIQGGYKENVIPESASATIDGRYLPGHEDTFARTLADLAGDSVRVTTLFSGSAVEAPSSGRLIDSMQRALTLEDPTAVVIPYMCSAFTDAKWVSKLGIRCYGFTPLLLPDDLDFPALFHGIDERVPIESLHFSVRVLKNLLDEY